MALSETTKRKLLFKRDPQRAIFEQQDRMSAGVEKAAIAAATKAVEGIKEELIGMLEDESSTIEERLKKINKRIESFSEESLNLIQKMVRERLRTMPQLKGEPGYTPKKGTDYFDGEPGAPGQTPRANIDYPTIESTRAMILSGMELFTKKIKTFVTELVDKAVEKAMNKGMAPAMIARALETLKGEARLDFEALKNRPGTPVSDTSNRHVLHRGGGGKQTYEYDLSDLCDGNTKSFVIPTNTRIVAVLCSDAPAGFYRKTTDYTGTGTTTLLLDADVAAPLTGATLSILYVV